MLLILANTVVVCLAVVVTFTVATVGLKQTLTTVAANLFLLSIPSCTYIYIKCPGVFDYGIGKPMGIVVTLVIAIVVITACYAIKHQGLSSPERSVQNDIEDIKKRDQARKISDDVYLRTLAFTHWPENAKNPVTGKRYSPRERTPENAAKWFLGPQETTDEI